MSSDDPIVEYIDDQDNDVAAYYYSDEEVDPFLKQKENEKNTNKSNDDDRMQTSLPTTVPTNFKESKITATEKFKPSNNNSNTSTQKPEPGAIEDGEIDDGEILNETKAVAGASEFDQARIDILGFLSDTSKTSDKAAVVTRLAEYFGEPRSDLLDLAVEHLDIGQLTALVLESTTIEQNGGMRTADGKRKRTFGGVFFYIMGKKVPKEAKKAIFGADQKLRKQAQLQRQRNHKQSNNRGTHYRGRGNARGHGDRGDLKRKRESDSDTETLAKKQKLTV